jgi:CBS domain-containing protein
MMPEARKPEARITSVTAYASYQEIAAVGQTPLRRLVRGAPLIVRPDSTLRDSLFALNESESQAGVVAESGRSPLGVVTLHDMVEAIALRKGSLDDPTFAFMTAAPLTLPADATVHRARVTMTRTRQHHLLLIEPDGSLFDLLSSGDLPGFREGGAAELVERIEIADNVDSMARAADAVRQRAVELFANGMGVEALCQWMSGLNDLINIRVIELVADEFDLPPVSWSWMVFGSEGRLEQMFATDQDNGLIFQPDNESDTTAVRAALVPFAQAVNTALDLCGFRRCPGDIMAGNPAWCLSANEWRDRFGGWMAKPEPQALLNATIFFDLRPLYGQDELVDELQQWLLPLPAQHPRFLRALAEQALGCTPSLGWFGKFVYDGGHRYPHTIDLKVRGVRPFVDSARIYALRHGVGLTNTMERLRAVGPLDQRAPSDTVASIEALELIQRLRLQRQLAGGEFDEVNRVDPAALTAPQRMMLKEAFRQARLLQLRLQQAFLS